MCLMQTDVEGVVRNTSVDISRQMVKNLQRKMTQWLLGSFDELPGVRFGKGDTQVFSRRLPE